MEDIVKISVPTIGEFLKEEYMDDYHLSAYKLAKDIGVPVSRIQDILHNRRRLTADTSIRLGRYFGLDDGFFLRVQAGLDLHRALDKIDKDSLSKIVPINGKEEK